MLTSTYVLPGDAACEGLPQGLVVVTYDGMTYGHGWT